MENFTLKERIEIVINKKAWRIIENMDQFRKDGLFCDVTINCEDGTSFQCHRLVMAAASPYFAAMFQTNMLERSQSTILIKNVDSRAFKSLLNYAYNGEIKTDCDEIIPLLSAANMLRFEAVEDSCISFLYKNLNITNCIDICTVAQTLNYDELLRTAEIYVIKNFRWLVRHSKFNEMTAAQLESVISNENLSIASESEAYQAVLTWVRYEPMVRCKHLGRLLKHIRFTSISRKYLVDVVIREGMIMDDFECRKLVLNVLDHYLLPERRSSSQCLLPRKTTGQTLFVVGGKGNYISM